MIYIMLRHNKEIQVLADKCAQENGFFCASYLGRKGDVFVYEPCKKSSEEKCVNVQPIIIVEDGKAEFAYGGRVFDIIRDMKFRDYKKGRSIYKEYERKVDEFDFNSLEENLYISYIVFNQRPGHDVPVPKTDLYKYLEIADRLNMKIELKPYRWSTSHKGPWRYYIELMEEVNVFIDKRYRL